MAKAKRPIDRVCHTGGTGRDMPTLDSLQFPEQLHIACGKLGQPKAQYCLIMRPDTALISDQIPPYYATIFSRNC